MVTPGIQLSREWPENLHPSPARMKKGIARWKRSCLQFRADFNSRNQHYGQCSKNQNGYKSV